MKIGIIGLGFMGATHIRALADIPLLQLAAVSTTNKRALSGDLTAAGGNLGESGGTFDFSGLRKYENWRELIADDGVEAVDICLPTDLHAEVAIAALAAGKHVLCEKPMALCRADCERMLQAAAQYGRTLMIGHVLRFWPEYLVLEKFVKDNKATLRAIMLTRSCGLPEWSRWLPLEERSGGAVFDLLIHDIDQAIWLCGMPESVEARSLGPVDTLQATLHYPGGKQVSIAGGWLGASQPFQMGFEAQTAKETLSLSSNKLVLQNEAGARSVSPEAGENAYRAQLAYFAECCRGAAEPTRCPPMESAAAVRLAELLKKSRAQEGERIQCLD